MKPDLGYKHKLVPSGASEEKNMNIEVRTAIRAQV